jgi:hypothetical protein
MKMAKRVECIVIPTYYITLELCELPATEYPRPAPAKGVSKSTELFFDKYEATRRFKACKQAMEGNK